MTITELPDTGADCQRLATLALASGITILATAWIPVTTNHRTGRIEWFYADSWRVDFDLELPDDPAIKAAPTVAVFSETNGTVASIAKILTALGESDPMSHAAATALIRKLRDDAMSASAAWNAAKEADIAAKRARKRKA